MTDVLPWMRDAAFEKIAEFVTESSWRSLGELQTTIAALIAESAPTAPSGEDVRAARNAIHVARCFHLEVPDSHKCHKAIQSYHNLADHLEAALSRHTTAPSTETRGAVADAQEAAARIIPGFVPVTLSERLALKAADLRKTIEHAKANDSGWCDTAPIFQWECEASDLEEAASIVASPTHPACPESGEDARAAFETMRGICAEIVSIMAAYDEQNQSRFGVDTPGGLEHMGDVWRLLDSWRRQLAPQSASGEKK